MFSQSKARRGLLVSTRLRRTEGRRPGCLARPLVTLRFPKLFNIQSDPFETADHESMDYAGGWNTSSCLYRRSSTLGGSSPRSRNSRSVKKSAVSRSTKCSNRSSPSPLAMTDAKQLRSKTSGRARFTSGGSRVLADVIHGGPTAKRLAALLQVRAAEIGPIAAHRDGLDSLQFSLFTRRTFVRCTKSLSQKAVRASYLFLRLRQSQRSSPQLGNARIPSVKRRFECRFSRLQLCFCLIDLRLSHITPLMTQPNGSPSPIRRCLADRLGVELRTPR